MPGPLRVVYLDHVARLSGGEIALLRLLPALAPDVAPHVILGEDGPLVDRLHAAGISVEVLPMAERVRDLRKDAVQPTGFDLRSLPSLTTYVATLRNRLRALRPDLVHTNSLKAALYGGAAGRLAGVPVVWHVRDRIADDYLPRPAVRLVHAAARVLPSAIVANSAATLATVPTTRTRAVVHSPAVSDADPVIPDVVPPLATADRAAARTAHDGPLRVGVVGRLAPWKGQHVFLDAFAQAFPDADVATAAIVGSPLFGEEAYAADLHAQAERLGVADRVEWRGFREDVGAELAALDVLVHCSTVPEPFGQVVVEGMAAGLPVVAAAAGGPLEIVDDGRDGLLTPPGDTVALANELRRLAHDPALRQRLGAAACISAQRYGPQAARERLLAVYDQVLRTRGRR